MISSFQRRIAESLVFIGILSFLSMLIGGQSNFLNYEFIKKDYRYHVIANIEILENNDVVGEETIYPKNDRVLGLTQKPLYSDRTIVPSITNPSIRQLIDQRNDIIVIDSLLFLGSGIYRNFFISDNINYNTYSCGWCIDHNQFWIEELINAIYYSSIYISEIIIESVTRTSLIWKMIVISFIVYFILHSKEVKALD